MLRILGPERTPNQHQNSLPGYVMESIEPIFVDLN